MVKLVKERPVHRNYLGKESSSSSEARSCSSSSGETTSSKFNSNFNTNTPTIIPPIPPLGGVGDNGIFNKEKNGKKEEEKVLLKDVCWDVLELVTELNKQSTSTRKRILDELALGLKQESSTSASRDVEMWLKAVTTELTAVLASQFYFGNAMKQSVVGWSYVEEFMHSSGLSRCSVVQRAGIYRILASLLIKHAQHIAEHVGQPLSLKFVLSCSNAVPGLFDAAYPGYLSSGMASAVVAAMKT